MNKEEPMHFLSSLTFVEVFGLSIVVISLVVVALLKGRVFFIGRTRMNYSPEADTAFQRFVGAIQGTLVAENEAILQIEGVWLYGYPKVAILFTAEDALSQAKESGLIDRIASNLATAVRDDPAFGRNRESFDRQQAVWATADKRSWRINIEKKFSDENDSEQVLPNNMVT
jgi:hypothetical protein